MGKYIVEHGGHVSGFYNRTASSGKEAAQFCSTDFFTELDSLMEVSDILFIAVSDGAVEELWNRIALGNVKGKVICHFSGSLSSDIFSNAEEKGALPCSLHPIYAFSNKFTAYENLTKALFTVEGNSKALLRMQELFALLPNRIVPISTAAKTKYHAAASIASNHVAGLIFQAVELLKEAGILEDTAYDMLKPLVWSNVENVFASDCAKALTGPIERADAGTVKKHLEAMEQPEWEQEYRAVGTLVTQLARRKHPEKDYGEIARMLKESKSRRNENEKHSSNVTAG